MKYFYVQDRLEQRFDPVVPKFTSIQRPGGCAACGFVPLGLPPMSPLAVRPEVRRPRAKFTSTSWGFCVIHVDLIATMTAEILPCLRFGTMVLESGAPMADFKTVRAVEHVVMRDGSHSVHRVCEVCGALRYTGWPGDEPYVMSWNLRSQAPVYEVESESLLIREDIREHVGDRWSDVIAFHEVSIVDVPRDGLPAKLDVIPTADQLIGYRPNASTRTSTISK